MRQRLLTMIGWDTLSEEQKEEIKEGMQIFKMLCTKGGGEGKLICIYIVFMGILATIIYIVCLPIRLLKRVWKKISQ